MNLLILTKYARLAPSSRLRFFQYLPYLQSAGFNIRVSSLLDDTYVMRLNRQQPQNWPSIFRNYLSRFAICLSAQPFDVVWIQAELFPWLTFFFEKQGMKRLKRTVVEYDDAVFHKYDQSKSWIVRKLFGSKIDRIMQNASLVIAGNSYLAQRAKSAGSLRVEVLPTVVDLARYPHQSRERRGPFTIGWIGSPSTAKYLYGIQEALRSLCLEEHCKLVAVGSGPLNFAGVPVEIREWSEEKEVELMRDFDVGIMPLPQEPWAQGKCGYKLIQYMACGIPVVASPVGVNREIVKADCGFLVESMEDWVKAIRALQNNPELCNSLSRSGHQRVEKEYSLQITAPLVVQRLRNIARPEIYG